MTTSPTRPCLWLPAALLLSTSLACDGTPTGADPICQEELPVEPGDVVGGRLQTGDRRFAGAYIDYFGLGLAQDAGVLTVTLSSFELDPLLLIFIADADTLVQAFDPMGQPPGTEETAAWTTPPGFVLPAGCHLIGVSTWYPDSTGAYTLSVQLGPPQPGARAPPP